MKLEEERFFKTIEDGIKLFNAELKKTSDMFNGEVAFKLYDTFGFPLDLTEDMLREEGKTADIAAFDSLMKAQRERAKAAWKGSGDDAVSGDFKALLEAEGENEFIGYHTLESDAKVLALLDESFKQTASLEAGNKGWVLLDKTPFYAMSGGQTGDEGTLVGVAKVLDTKKFFELNLSEVAVEKALKVGDTVHAKVAENRLEIQRHHSATHLLQSALKAILGEHVSQAGSLNDDKRLRFDFSHPKAVSAQELEKIEAFVNDAIARGLDTKTELMSIQEAKKSGAMALFGEKYGDEVRVVSMGDVSMELCGGTHVDNVAEIGAFFITKESGVSAGVRRIEAVCSRAAYAYAKEIREHFLKVAAEVKNSDPLLGINRLKSEIKTLKSEMQSLQSASKKSLEFNTIAGVEVAVEVVENGDIKAMIDEMKNQKESLAVMLFQQKGEKVMMAAGVKNASAKAGAWIKEVAPIVGGGGGGRDDFAQAGGKDASKLEEAKSKALAYIQETLS
jgi:alanyl-tRNA synthetase